MELPLNTEDQNPRSVDEGTGAALALAMAAPYLLSAFVMAFFATSSSARNARSRSDFSASTRFIIACKSCSLSMRAFSNSACNSVTALDEFADASFFEYSSSMRRTFS